MRPTDRIPRPPQPVKHNGKQPHLGAPGLNSPNYSRAELRPSAGWSAPDSDAPEHPERVGPTGTDDFYTGEISSRGSDVGRTAVRVGLVRSVQREPAEPGAAVGQAAPAEAPIGQGWPSEGQASADHRWRRLSRWPRSTEAAPPGITRQVAEEAED